METCPFKSRERLHLWAGMRMSAYELFMMILLNDDDLLDNYFLITWYETNAYDA